MEENKKFLIDLENKKKLKNFYLEQSSNVYFNLFFDFDDDEDPNHFMYEDVCWPERKIHKPYYFSLYGQFMEERKWFYARMIKTKKLNIVIPEEDFLKPKEKNMWKIFKERKQNKFDESIREYFLWGTEKIYFTFKRYYHYSWDDLNYQQNFFLFTFSLTKKFAIIFFSFFKNFPFKDYLFLNKDNTEYLFFEEDSIYWFDPDPEIPPDFPDVLHIAALFKIPDRLLEFTLLINRNKKRTLGTLSLPSNFIEEKQKNTINIRSYLLKQKELTYTMRRRMKLLDFYYDYYFEMPKPKPIKRTNNQINIANFRKEIIGYIITLDLAYKYRLDYVNSKIIKLKENFKGYGLKIKLKKNNDDRIFVKKQVKWINYFKKLSTDPEMNMIDVGAGKVTIVNLLKGVFHYNKIQVEDLYNFVTKKNYKKLVLSKNFISNSRFILENNTYRTKCSFIFSIYYWLVTFLKILKKSVLFSLKKILDFSSFFVILQIVFSGKFDWKNFKNIEVRLLVLTIHQKKAWLKCNINVLFREAGIFIINNFDFEQEKIEKYKNFKLWSDVNYIFKGHMNLDINGTLCLDILKKKIKKGTAFELFSSFLNNCYLSVNFIEDYYSLYWSLLNLTYTELDKFISRALKKEGLHNKIKLLRYKNTIILGCEEQNLLKDFVSCFYIPYFFFVYRNYFFFCKIYNLLEKEIKFNGYLIVKDGLNVKLKSSKLIVLYLLIFYKFIKKDGRKIIIEPSNHILNRSKESILNFFLNLVGELSFFLNDREVFNYSRIILFKVCFFTLSLKLKKKELKLKKWKKMFGIF